VFLSIKGIYYQAEIQGQSITWIVPYQFSQNVPLDVDFKVMGTFLQFYRTLLGFVNYRLYTTSNLSYPPKVDQSMDDSAAGLGSLRIEAKRVEDLIKATQPTETTVPEVAMTKEMKQRMETLGSKIKKIVAADTTAPAYESVGDADGDQDDESQQSDNQLFAKQVFYLSREVPRYSLEFVIRAFGGRLGWDQTSGGGSPYAENDRTITVQISDRPVQGHQFLDRIYVQPQWVYDSINARRLLDVDDYLIGQTLPAHLSPFVEYEEGDYVPEAASKLAAAAGFEGEVTNLKPEDRDQSEDSEEEDVADIDGASADEDAPDSDDDEEDEDAIAEKQHQKQLLAERAGVSFSEYQQKQTAKPKPTAAGKKRSKAEIEEEERQKIAISMLSKKKRKVVNRTQADAYKKAKDVNTLKTRKAQAAKSAKGKKN
ncbi:mRNA-binding ribosome synthesis protein nop7, partial [Coemansia sp. RSA 2671]